jgi:hypothetical protein
MHEHRQTETGRQTDKTDRREKKKKKKQKEGQTIDRGVKDKRFIVEFDRFLCVDRPANAQHLLIVIQPVSRTVCEKEEEEGKGQKRERKTS